MSAKHEWDRAYRRRPERRGRCLGCGELKGYGCRRFRLCRPCWRVVVDVRRSLAAGMYLDGWTHREMGEAIGMSVNAMSVYVSRLRRYGWDLPRRLGGKWAQ